MKSYKNILIIFVHLVVWVCFFMLPYIFSDPPRENTPFILQQHRTVLLIVLNVYLLVFYYLNTLLLIPKLLFSKKWPIYWLLVVLFFIGFVNLPRPIVYAINGTSEKIVQNVRDTERNAELKQRIANMNIDTAKLSKFQKDSIDNILKKANLQRNKNPAFRTYFPGSFVVFLLVFSIGICIAIVQQWLLAERTKKEVQHEKTNTELSFLKSQVNPHFFFNTLNNIYSLAVVQSDKTAPTVMRLSSIMRYILTETQTERVPLEKEVDFVRNFIDLQLVRLTDKVKVNFHTEGSIGNIQVAPLLFISFVENAFKYGVSTKEASEINILFKASGNRIYFNVVNTIVKADNGIIDNTGIGLNNAKRKLELLYPEKHTLKVSNDGKIFEVKLEIETV